MTTTKKKNNKNKEDNNRKKKEIITDNDKSDIKAVIYIFIGVLLAISTYTNNLGALSVFSRKVLYSFVGVLIYIIPAYLVFFGINIIKSRGTIKYTRRFLGTTFIAIVFWLLWSTIGIQNGIKTNGGLLGCFISYPLCKIMGYVGSYILYIAILVIGCILLTDFTLYDIYIKIKAIFKLIMMKLKFTSGSNKNISKSRKDKNKRTTIVPKEADIQKEEFLNGINNKIQILDFMRNSELQDINSIEDNPLRGNSETIIEKDNKKEEREISPITNREIEINFNSLRKDTEKVYVYPTMDLLKINSKLKLKNEDKKDLIDGASKLEETLSNFGVEAKVIQVTKGPSVTRFELQPSPGVKVSKIVNLQDDIALGLAATGVRMEAPIPGKAAIGIEVPNKKQSPVLLREVLDSGEFTKNGNKLSFALGKDITGKCIVGDLSKMPHMLIAGATGSGKSVCINSLIISLLYKYSPNEVKLLLVDPKVVELSVYNGIPHLLIPVVTDPKKAAGALNWAVNEMNKRYNLFSQMKVKNIESYNNLLSKGEIEEKLPYVVIIVDELADLMMACPNDVEDYICRLAQMARAAGMHLIIATQRPSVDVITGVIKANIPSRVSFAVSSGIDSRTILDQVGAEKLLGRGDMLYYPIGENKPIRVQGAFISEEEVENVVEYIKKSDEVADYSEDIINHINSEVNIESNNDSEEDELLDEAKKIVIQYQQASTSFLQRKLRVGFNRASRIMDELEEHGVISAKDGSRPRQVLISKEEIYNYE